MFGERRRDFSDRNSMTRFRRRVTQCVVLLLLITSGLWGGWSLLKDRSLTRAIHAYEKGAWQAAATEAREILKAEPGRRNALTLLARAEARLGRDQFARSIYGQLDPRELLAEDYFLVGRGLIAEGQFEAGRYGLDRALALDPMHPEVLLELARQDRRFDRLAEAGEAAARLATLPHWKPRGLVLLGLVRLEQDDPASAALAFRSALSHDPSLTGVAEGSPDEVRKWLAQCLLRAGRPIDARTLLDVILAARPGDAQASWLLSRAALQQHDRASATAALDHAGDYRADRPEEFEYAPYVGIARCAECHPSNFRAQRKSHHAQTFRVSGELGDVPLPDRPRADPADPEVIHTIAREGRDVTFRTHTQKGDLRAVVEYAFGSGDRAITLVGRDSNRSWCELRLSYYGSIRGWDRTPAHRVRPESSHEFLGLVQNDDALRRCLGCHTTYSRVGPGGPVVSSERGFSCERCHGPAGNHLDAVALRFPDPAIGRPRLASAKQLNALCGQCHSAVGRGITADNPELARFQASALPLSRCVTADRKPMMSCLTCHDPHRDAETAPGFYEAKCLNCHAARSDPDDSRTVVCPVNASRGCVTCHMPRVQTSVPNTTFTDHFIRVYPATLKAE
jgi:tetratricopeptide (TPR) repeat protein